MDEPPQPPPGAWSRPDLTPPHRRPGIPPAHPHHVPYLQIPPSPAPPAASSRSPTPHHSRSLSQPPFFTLDSLPPFSSPSPPPQAASAAAAPWSASPPRSDGLPPLKAHRRSVSDIPFGFVQSQPQIPPRAPPRKQEPDWEADSGAAAGDEFLAACMNFDSMEDGSRAGNSSDYEEGESSSFNESGNSEPQRKEGNKRSAGEFTSVGPRHSRSVSVDSFMDKLNFGDVSPSPGPQRGQHERSGSMDGMAPDFGNGEFNPAEIKKIMQNDKLSEMAMTDPKKVKRILANRLSAARSKERKTRYISELEHKVQTLQAEATTLSNQVTMLQRDSTGLTHQNNELKFRLQAMESQAQLRDALNEQLKAEVDRLKVATGEIGEAQLSNRLNQQIQLNPQMYVQQQLQKQQLHQQHHQQQSAQMYQLQQLQQQQQLLHRQNNSVQKTEPNT